MTEQTNSATLPVGTSETGALILSYDWTATPLGPISAWPQSLISILGFVLGSRVPLVLLWGEDGIMLYNDAYAEFAGQRHPALLGSKVREGWEEVADFNDNVMRVGLAGGTLEYRGLELTLVRNGKPESAWLDLDYSPVFDDAGKPVGVLAVVVEVTDRKRSEAQFSVFAQLMPNQAWAARADGYIYWLNDQAYRYSGAAPGTMLGQTAWGEFVHPDDLPEAASRWAAALASGDSYETEFRVRRHDGVYRWFLTRAQPVRGPDGGILGWVGTNTDVHDRLEAEAELRSANETLEEQVAIRTAEVQAKEARLRAVFETSFSLQCLLDTGGHVLDANATALKAVDCTLDDLIGHPFWETPWFAGTAGVGDQIRDSVERARAGEAAQQQLLLHLPIGGWRWFDLMVRPIREIDGRVVAIASEAVETTERRKAEEALRQSQKLEAMGQLTGGVAHDFNNLLTPIIGSLDMLHRRELGSDRERRLIEAGLQSAERAKTLVQRLLAFARRQPLQPRPVDVAALIESMRDLVVSTSGPRIRVEIAMEDRLPAAIAEVNQLEMAILNLAVNARDAMPDGGTLTIAALRRQLAADNHLGLKPGQYVGVTVSDTGVGMDDETRRRAVEPFFSTKGIGRGTGLGLSMVHGLTLQLGGALDIASRPGLGTRIELLLPHAPGEAADMGGEAQPVVARRADASVLLVDDEAPVRASTAEMLAELGYVVIEAASGEEAIERIDRERVDLVITDHLMGGMTGMALVDRLRSKHPALPTLIVTGYADTSGLADDVPRLTKPFRLAELATMLESLRRGEGS